MSMMGFQWICLMIAADHRLAIDRDQGCPSRGPQSTTRDSAKLEPAPTIRRVYTVRRSCRRVSSASPSGRCPNILRAGFRVPLVSGASAARSGPWTGSCAAPPAPPNQHVLARPARAIRPAGPSPARPGRRGGEGRTLPRRGARGAGRGRIPGPDSRFPRLIGPLPVPGNRRPGGGLVARTAASRAACRIPGFGPGGAGLGSCAVCRGFPSLRCECRRIA
jgi:hypothetical protein